MTAHDPNLARPNAPTTTYRYDEFDAAFVKERVAEFREQVRRRLLEGKLVSEDDMKAVDAEIRAIVTAAAEFAQNDPEPDESELWTDVLVEA